jgi:uncharacterized protein with PIN domain
MTYAFKPKRTRCPYCSKRVALTSTGKLHSHTDPTTHKPCPRRSPS